MAATGLKTSFQSAGISSAPVLIAFEKGHYVLASASETGDIWSPEGVPLLDDTDLVSFWIDEGAPEGAFFYGGPALEGNLARESRPTSFPTRSISPLSTSDEFTAQVLGTPWLTDDYSRPTVTRQGELPARILVQQLRDLTRLPLTRLADVLSVSRRTIYHWLSGGTISTSNYERLFRLTEALRPLAEQWRPTRIREWLEGQLSVDTTFWEESPAEFGAAIARALELDDRQLRTARRLEPGAEEGGPVQPLTAIERAAALTTFLSLRPETQARQRVLELTDSLLSEEE